MNFASMGKTQHAMYKLQHAIYKLGNIIPHIIWQMVLALENGIPLLFSKINLKEGYWCIVVDKRDSWNFVYILPTEHPDDEPEMIIPDVLQIHWSDSPPFFCAATDTSWDHEDKYYHDRTKMAPHPENELVLNIDWNNIPYKDFDQDKALLYLLEVYIDNFIAMIQCIDINKLTLLTHYILTGITKIFPPPDVSGSTMGPPISDKKLIKEGLWEVQEEILG